MKILLITDSYPPEVRSSSHLMRELAEGLRRRGHRVFVATSCPAHNIAEKERNRAFSRDTVENGIRILRTGVIPHHNAHFIQKGIAQISMPYLFLREIKRCIKEDIDAVIVHSPPLPLSIVGRKAASRFRARYVLNVHDIFPQNAVDLGVLKNKLVIAVFELMERRAYGEADTIMVPSETHRKFLIEKRNIPEHKILVVPHWIDVTPFAKAERSGGFRKRYGVDESAFVLVFAGNLGPSQALDGVLKAASRLRDDKNIIFLFVGDGIQREQLMKTAREGKLHNVVFQPLVSKEEYPALLKETDAGIAALSGKNTTPAVPAKIMGYMAAGIPVLAMLHRESDGIRIVEESGCGVVVPADDSDSFAEAARRMARDRASARAMGQKGLEYAREKLSVDRCAEKLEKLLA